MTSLHYWAQSSFVLTVTVCLLYDLTQSNVTHDTSVWLAGYKVFFLVMSVRSLARYGLLELSAILGSTRQLQYSSLCTTSKGEVFAAYREKRLSESQKPDTFNSNCQTYEQHHAWTGPDLIQCGQRDTAPVYWSSFVTLLIIYNTAHLALSPLPDTSALFFGAPAFVIYSMIVKTINIFLHATWFYLMIMTILVVTSLPIFEFGKKVVFS